MSERRVHQIGTLTFHIGGPAMTAVDLPHGHVWLDDEAWKLLGGLWYREFVSDRPALERVDEDAVRLGVMRGLPAAVESSGPNEAPEHRFLTDRDGQRIINAITASVMEQIG